MALKQTQEKVGTTRRSSPPDEVSRTGRDSYLKKSGSVGHTRSKDAPDVARTGRGSGFGPNPGHSHGVGRGRADKGGGDAKRLPKDGVNGDLSL